jgi:hypothetical protein
MVWDGKETPPLRVQRGRFFGAKYYSTNRCFTKDKPV